MSLSGLSGLSGLGLSGGAAPWSPADLPGLAAWYTASPLYCFTDAGATTPCGDGGPIYTWTDRSGNGRTLSQATLAYRPILYSLGGGLWCATFDGIDDFLSMASDVLFAAAGTAGWVEQRSAAGVYGLLLGSSVGAAGCVEVYTDGRAYWVNDTAAQVRSLPAADSTARRRWVVRNSGAASAGGFTGLVDGSAPTPDTGCSADLTARYLGTRTTGDFTSGDVSEVVVSTAAATDPAVLLLDDYLSGR